MATLLLTSTPAQLRQRRFTADAVDDQGAMQVRVGALVAGALDVHGASPRRFFFEMLSHFTSAPHEVERLQYFASAAGRDDLAQYNQREGLLMDCAWQFCQMRA